MPHIHIVWLVQAEWKCITAILIYKPRLPRLSSQLCSWLLFRLSSWAKETGLWSVCSCSSTSLISIGLSKTSILWSMKAFFASLPLWSYSWNETLSQTVAGLQVFLLVSYCITRSRFHLKVASLGRSYYSVSEQSSYHVSTTYLPTSKTTAAEHPCLDCTKHKLQVSAKAQDNSRNYQLLQCAGATAIPSSASMP